MRNLFEELQHIKEDGTYVITDTGIEDYAERVGYGYIVGLRSLVFNDLKPHLLFGIWTDGHGNQVYNIVKHVAATQDAIKLAIDFDQEAIYDLMLREVKYVNHKTEELTNERSA